jgi:hypothetical protein
MNGNTKENEMKYMNQTTVYDNIEIRDIYNGTAETFRKCDELSEQGFFFIPGNNYRLGETEKWKKYSPIRVAQTNSRFHSRCIQTLWAVRDSDLESEESS